MKKLFICNTPYQIIVSAILAKQVNMSSFEECDILVSDNFSNSSQIKNNILNDNLFKRVYYAKIHSFLFSKNIKSKLLKLFYFFFPRIMSKKCIFPNIYNTKYDEIYYNNDDLFLYNLFYLVQKKGKTKIFRYEEGYSSYLSPYCSSFARKICDLRNLILLKDLFVNNLVGYYFFEPSLLCFKTQKSIFKINRCYIENIKSHVKNYFGLSSNIISFSQKFIIFEESFFEDFRFNEDFNLYTKIINRIGKDNVCLKLHPRSRVNRFSSLNILIFPNNGIPWEAVLMSSDFSSKVFFTLSSGSVINARLLLGNNNKSYLLWKCIQNQIPNISSNFIKFMNKFNKLFGGDSLSCPDSISDFFDLIEIG